jgi:hypothetical protein
MVLDIIEDTFILDTLIWFPVRVEKNSLPPANDDIVRDEMTIELPIPVEMFSLPPMIEDTVREETRNVLPVRMENVPVR